MNQVLAIIPARGGSKGLPRKNLRLLAGHPLVAWAVGAALQAKSITRTVCSTDDLEIAQVARKYGAEVPFLRPAELAQNLTPDLPVFQHVLDWLDRHERWRPDIVVQLRPTSPLRLSGMVDEAVQMLEHDPLATAVRAVCPAPCNPHKMWRLDEPNATSPYMNNLLQVPGVAEPYNAPRQALPPVWWQIGTIDVVRTEVILGGSMTGSHILPLKVIAKLAIDIDGEESLRLAELVLPGMECIRPGPPLDWQRIKLLALDVDGTLTPGTIYYGPEGEQLKRFHTHDGMGIVKVRELGVEVALVTQEATLFTQVRAAKLGISEVHSGVDDKLSVIHKICLRRGLTLAQVAYVGDDLGDLPVMSAIGAAGGIACAVGDARPEVKAVAGFISSSPGGCGAVREVCDLLVHHRNSR